MQKFVFFLALVATSAARAEDVYVVMHTDGAAEAAVHGTILATLADRGLQVKLAPTPQELASGLQATACTNDADVCALAVGRALGGTHVIASRATSKDGVAQLAVSFHDLQALTIVRHAHAGLPDELRRWARVESLGFAKQELRGTLRITELGAGAMVLLDDGDVIAMPMTSPVVLPLGAHQLEARVDDGPVYKQSIVIEAEVDSIVRLCANGSYIAPCESASTVTPSDSGLHVMRVAGFASMAVGALAVGFGGWAHVQAVDRTITATGAADHDTFKAIALTSYVAGGVLIAGGAAAALAATLVE